MADGSFSFSAYQSDRERFKNEFELVRFYHRHMSFINADGNITSLSLQRTTGVYEGNPLAAPLAEGDSHYINCCGGYWFVRCRTR